MLKILSIVALALELSSFAFAQGVPSTLPPKKIPSQNSESATPPATEVEIAKTGITPASPENSKGQPVDLGYPKHQAQISYNPLRVRLEAERQSEKLQSDLKASGSYEILYRYFANPQDEVELDYSWAQLETSAGSVVSNSLGPLLIQESSTQLDSLFLRFRRFWFDQHNFFHRYGVGFEFGADSYPTLAFSQATELSLSKIRDLVIGLNFNYRRPLSPNLLFTASSGLNHGTGASADSGGLKVKNNLSYFAFLSAVWALDSRSSLELGWEYRVRQADISGNRGGVSEDWKSRTSSATTQIGYSYLF